MVTSERPSKTERNLWDALMNEAVAQVKYNAFAQKALEEGYPEVAQFFQEIAQAENGHGISHLRSVGAVKSTLENLRGVISEEGAEFEARYPRMIRDALQEGSQSIAEDFARIRKQEQSHLEGFMDLLEGLERKLGSPEAPAASPAESKPRAAVSTSPLARLQRGGELPSQAMREAVGERRRVSGLGRIREVIFGAQDGLMSTLALVTAIVAATTGSTTVLIVGMAGALAGMISMASGTYLGSKAARQVLEAEVERERLELEANPAEELAELIFLYRRDGMTAHEASELAERIASDKALWLRTLVEKELGISPDLLANPMKDALAMGASYILAAMVPVLPFFFMEGSAAIVASAASALTTLFVLGTTKGKLVRRSPIQQGLEVLAIGSLAAGLGFLLGEGIPRVF